jgi:hypothetical protein
MGVVGFALAVTTTLVVAAVWLLVTDPVTVADAATDGELSPLVQALATILMDAVIGLFGYL